MLGNKYVAIAVGIVLMLVTAYNARSLFSKSRQPEPTVSHIAQVSRPPEHEPAVMPERITSPGDKGQWKRDPFSLARDIKIVNNEKEPEKHEPDIRLMGIIKRDGRSLALIDGKVYRVHDEFDDAVIKEIRQHSIVVILDGEPREIAFDDYVVLKEKTK